MNPEHDPADVADHLLGRRHSCLGMLKLVQFTQTGCKGTACNLQLSVVSQQLFMKRNGTGLHYAETTHCFCHLFSIGPVGGAAQKGKECQAEYIFLDADML